MEITRKPDFIEVGEGQKIILLHSSVSRARQWRCLMDTLAYRFHLIAINLFGYGETREWVVSDVSAYGAKRLFEHQPC